MYVCTFIQQKNLKNNLEKLSKFRYLSRKLHRTPPEEVHVVLFDRRCQRFERLQIRLRESSSFESRFRLSFHHRLQKILSRKHCQENVVVTLVLCFSHFCLSLFDLWLQLCSHNRLQKILIRKHSLEKRLLFLGPLRLSHGFSSANTTDSGKSCYCTENIVHKDTSVFVSAVSI